MMKAFISEPAISPRNPRFRCDSTIWLRFSVVGVHSMDDESFVDSHLYECFVDSNPRYRPSVGS